MTRTPLIAMLFLTGCATLVNGTHETLQIRTEPEEVSFSIRDPDGRDVASGRTPASVHVARSSGFFQPARYELHLSKPGYIPKTTPISTRIDAWWWIDWLLLVPGFLVDPFTGAMWDLEEPRIQRLAPEIPFAPAREGSKDREPPP